MSKVSLLLTDVLQRSSVSAPASVSFPSLILPRYRSHYTTPRLTAFNINLLQEQIPAKRNIGYLFVVNNNPIQLSTVKSVIFADDLKLNALYWHLIFTFIPRPSKYVAMILCIRKEQLTGLVRCVPYLYVISQCHRKPFRRFRPGWHPIWNCNCGTSVTPWGH